MLEYIHSRVVTGVILKDGCEAVYREERQETESIGSAEERLATFRCTECGADVVGRKIILAFGVIGCPKCGR